MATIFFRGDAQGRAQETHVTPANIEAGDQFILTINRKDITLIAAAGETVATLVARFVLAIGTFNNSIAEWAEVSANSGTDGAGAVTYLKLTGLPDGTPFTVTASVVNNSVLAITCTSLQAGTASTNQRQRIILPGPPTGGNFTLTMRGATTGNIAYNASAATVKTAIEGLSTVGASNTTVTLNGTGDWTVEFIGTLAITRMPNFSGTNVSLTGACSIQVSQSVEGRAANYAKGPVYTLTIAQSPVDSFRFKYTGGSGFSGKPYYSRFVSNSGTGATADDIRVALETILVPVTLIASTDTTDNAPPVAANQAYTLLDVTGPAGGPWKIIVRDGQGPALNATDSIVVDDANIYSAPGVLTDAGSAALAVVSAASLSGISEKQSLAIIGGPTGGTYTISFEGSTTAGIAYNAAAATVQTAFVGLASVGAGNCAVSGSGTTGDPFIFTFQSTLASINVNPITADASSLTGATPKIEIAQDAVLGLNSIQEISIIGGVPTGGTFTITGPGGTTTALAYNASAATVAAAFAVWSSAADYAVTGGPLASKAFIVEFKGSFAGGGAVSTMTGNAASLTQSNTQTLTVAANTTDPTGPHHLDNAENYSSNALPSAGDILIMANLSSGVYWGLTGLSGILLAEYHRMASCTAQIGLKPINTLNNGSYFEYRQTAAVIKATKFFIGEGDGTGSPFESYDFSSAATELLVYSTGQSQDNSIPPLCVKGSNTSNVFRFFKGTWGIAVASPNDTATVATIQVGFINDKESDSTGRVGAGTTWTTAQISGGTTIFDHYAANAGTLTANGGTITINGTKGFTTAFTLSGDAEVFWNTTGQMAVEPIIADSAVLDFSQSMQAKDIPVVVHCYGEGKVIDEFQTVASSVVTSDPFQILFGLVTQYHFSDIDCNGSKFGSNAIITRAVPGS